MRNPANEREMPEGLGMALAQNPAAMNRFASLPRAQQQRIIERTHSIHSKEEMQAFVRALLN